jgi:hypothetical protein
VGHFLEILKLTPFLLQTLSKLMAPDSTSAADAPAPAPGAGGSPEIQDDVKPLFTPTQLGDYQLENRLAMAPLTRCRGLNMVPAKAAITYYGQRAYKGSLLISEGTPVSQAGQG